MAQESDAAEQGAAPASRRFLIDERLRVSANALDVRESMTNTSAYGWSWFRRQIQDGVAFSERHCGELLDLIEEIDAVVGSIFSRPTSPLSDRPQDYVVSIRVARALRLTVSSLYIGFGGYPDSGTNP